MNRRTFLRGTGATLGVSAVGLAGCVDASDALEITDVSERNVSEDEVHVLDVTAEPDDPEEGPVTLVGEIDGDEQHLGVREVAEFADEEWVIPVKVPYDPESAFDVFSFDAWVDEDDEEEPTGPPGFHDVVVTDREDPDDEDFETGRARFSLEVENMAPVERAATVEGSVRISGDTYRESSELQVDANSTANESLTVHIDTDEIPPVYTYDTSVVVE